MNKKNEQKNTRQRDENAAEGALNVVDKKVLRRQELKMKKQQKKCMTSHAARADIRNIMSGIRNRRVVPQVNKKMVCGDMSNIPDLMQVMNIIEKGKQSFRNLPAVQREQFGNDPEKFIRFISKPNKTEAEKQMAIEIGLYERRPEIVEPDPQRVIVVENKNVQKTAKNEGSAQ